ncbi:hypothetical protein V1478_005350, partial [Vespula squamosa]
MDKEHTDGGLRRADSNAAVDGRGGGGGGGDDGDTGGGGTSGGGGGGGGVTSVGVIEGNRSKNGSEFNESSRESWLRSKYRSKEDEEEEKEEVEKVEEAKGGVVTWGDMAWHGMAWRGVVWRVLTSEFCPTLEKLQHLREQCRCSRDCKIFPGTIHLQGLLT